MMTLLVRLIMSTSRRRRRRRVRIVLVYAAAGEFGEEGHFERRRGRGREEEHEHAIGETVLVHVGCEDDAQREFHEERERDGCSHGRRRSCGRV